MAFIDDLARMVSDKITRRLSKLLLFVALLAWGAVACAQNYESLVRIHNGNSAGSGCLVGKDDSSGLIITCNHLFSEGNFGPVILFPNGERFNGTLLTVDAQGDLAAIAIGVPKAKPSPLADYRPEKGEQLFSAGFGSTQENRLFVNSGTVIKYTDIGDGSFPGIKLTGTVRAGDSGGPIFNERGELAAVIWGGNAEGVYGTGSHRVNVMLAQCRGGYCPPYRIQQPQWQPSQPQLQPVPPKPQVIAGKDGQPGPPGPKGDKGDPGPPGKPYDESKVAALEVRIAQLEAALAKPLCLVYLDAEGNPIEASRQTVHLGETLKIKAPPVRIIRPSGERDDLTWPLDGTSRLVINMQEQ